jgi:hypothetical protein
MEFQLSASLRSPYSRVKSDSPSAMTRTWPARRWSRSPGSPCGVIQAVNAPDGHGTW